MSKLRINGPVPGRKQKPNPCTITGYPRLGTFEGLGIVSTTTLINRRQISARLKGPNSHVHSKRRLHKDNLAHRYNDRQIKQGIVEDAFERARRLSLQIDRENNPVYLDAKLFAYNECITVMRENNAQCMVDKLIRLEACRGVVRAARA